jgi:hypothetical protein
MHTYMAYLMPRFMWTNYLAHGLDCRSLLADDMFDITGAFLRNFKGWWWTLNHYRMLINLEPIRWAVLQCESVKRRRRLVYGIVMVVRWTLEHSHPHQPMWEADLRSILFDKKTRLLVFIGCGLCKSVLVETWWCRRLEGLLLVVFP